MGKIQIAVPSYKRYDCENVKLFSEELFDITLFVNDEQEKAEYEKFNKVKVVATNTKGITPARNAILSYYKPQDEVVMADDDI